MGQGKQISGKEHPNTGKVFYREATKFHIPVICPGIVDGCFDPPGWMTDFCPKFPRTVEISGVGT